MRRRFKISLSQRQNRDRQPAKAQRTSNFSTLLAFKAKSLEHMMIHSSNILVIRNCDQQPAKAQCTSNFNTFLAFKATKLGLHSLQIYWLLEVVIQQNHSKPINVAHFWRSATLYLQGFTRFP